MKQFKESLANMPPDKLSTFKPFKRQSHKMVKHKMVDHFVKLAVEGLSYI